MMSLLRMVAFMRDNTYHLQRHVWNDVQEDWPFYTEQEKAMLRRRKPQNLTPPGSSDGSTGTTSMEDYQHVIYNYTSIYYTYHSPHLNSHLILIFVYYRQRAIAQFHPTWFTSSHHGTASISAE